MARIIEMRTAAPADVLRTVQLELPGVHSTKGLRQALAWLMETLECTHWTRHMHHAHGRYLLEYFGDVQVTTIGYPQLREYYNDEKKRGIAKDTIRKRLSTLKMAMRESIAHGTLDRLPDWPVIKGDCRSKDEWWTLVQWEAARLACDDDDLRTWIDLGWWTGMHTSDINRFRWQDVDLAAGTWVRRNTKTKIRPAVLPLPKRLLELLRARHQQLQPHARDLVAFDAGHPNRPLRALCSRAGVPNIGPIGLRHSCATYLEEIGATELFAMTWMGLKTAAPLKRHYRHITEPTLLSTMEAMNAGKRITG